MQFQATIYVSLFMEYSTKPGSWYDPIHYPIPLLNVMEGRMSAKRFIRSIGGALTGLLLVRLQFPSTLGRLAEPPTRYSLLPRWTCQRKRIRQLPPE
jgi:hypothetical protein